MKDLSQEIFQENSHPSEPATTAEGYLRRWSSHLGSSILGGLE